MPLAMSVVCLVPAICPDIALTTYREAQAQMLWQANGMRKMCQTGAGLPLFRAEADGPATKAPEDRS